MRVVPPLATLAEIQRTARNQPTAFILIRIYSTVLAKLANQLVVERCHQSKAIVILVGPGTAGKPEPASDGGAGRAQQRAGVDIRKVVLARGRAGHKQPSRPHTKVGGEKRALPGVMQPPQRDSGEGWSNLAHSYRLERSCLAYVGQTHRHWPASDQPVGERDDLPP